MMIKNRKIRRALWFFGLSIFVFAVWAFQKHANVSGVILMSCAIASVVLAFRKLQCAQCGKSLREISAGLTNCPFCGKPYEEMTKPK